MPAKIVAHKDFGRPKLAESHFGGALPAGAANPLWNDMLQAVSRGLFVKTDGEYAVLDDLTDFNELSIAKVVGICGAFPTGLAQEIYGYPAFVRIPAADIGNDVPSYLTGATTEPEEGDPEPKTWETWANSLTEVGDDVLIELNSSGVQEPGSVIAQLVADGFTVLSLPQAQAALAAV